VWIELGLRNVGVSYGGKFGSKIARKTSAYKIQAPGNCPKESIQLSEQGESLKSSINYLFITKFLFH